MFTKADETSVKLSVNQKIDRHVLTRLPSNTYLGGVLFSIKQMPCLLIAWVLPIAAINVISRHIDQSE